MTSINPVEMLQQQADIKAKVDRRKSELYQEILVEDFMSLYQVLPDVLKDRNFIDCQVIDLDGTKYAGYSLQYTDSDYTHYGLNIHLLFNGQADHVFVANANWRHGRYNGGKVLTDESLAEMLKRSPQSSISESIADMAFLVDLAETGGESIKDVVKTMGALKYEAAINKTGRARSAARNEKRTAILAEEASLEQTQGTA